MSCTPACSPVLLHPQLQGHAVLSEVGRLYCTPTFHLIAICVLLILFCCSHASAALRTQVPISIPCVQPSLTLSQQVRPQAAGSHATLPTSSSSLCTCGGTSVSPDHDTSTRCRTHSSHSSSTHPIEIEVANHLSVDR